MESSFQTAAVYTATPEPKDAVHKNAIVFHKIAIVLHKNTIVLRKNIARNDPGQGCSKLEGKLARHSIETLDSFWLHYARCPVLAFMFGDGRDFRR